MVRSPGEVISQIASYGRPNPVSGMMARAVTPAAVAPVLRDRPQPSPSQHLPSTVALAPAAMSALVEAQERLAQNAPVLQRQDTAEKLDQLISRLEAAAGSATDAELDAPFTVRRLQAARAALSPGLIDLQA
jgi:hypothetical protein